VTNNEKFILEELRVRRFADIQEEICRRTFWRWAILEWQLWGYNEKVGPIICV